MMAGATSNVARGISHDLSDLADNYADVGGSTTTYAVEIIARTDGSIDVLRDIGADLDDEEVYVTPASAAANTWIRCSHISGNDMTSGDSRGVWHRLNAERNFTMRYTSSGGPDDLSGTFDIELSTSASGTPIVASKIGVLINVGEVF